MLNYNAIVELVKKDSKILDLGCGRGELFKMLVEKKNASGIGIEIDQECVIEALENGVSVIQGDLDEGLKQFSDNSFDYSILNQTLQSTTNPEYVVKEMLRTSKLSIVSFPNFAYWKIRLYLLFKGKMPKSDFLPYEWYDTPNIHLLTIKDFFNFCKKRNIKIEKSIYLTRQKTRGGLFIKLFPNIFCEEGIFIISK